MKSMATHFRQETMTTLAGSGQPHFPCIVESDVDTLPTLVEVKQTSCLAECSELCVQLRVQVVIFQARMVAEMYRRLAVHVDRPLDNLAILNNESPVLERLLWMLRERVASDPQRFM